MTATPTTMPSLRERAAAAVLAQSQTEDAEREERRAKVLLANEATARRWIEEHFCPPAFTILKVADDRELGLDFATVKIEDLTLSLSSVRYERYDPCARVAYSCPRCGEGTTWSEPFNLQEYHGYDSLIGLGRVLANGPPTRPCVRCQEKDEVRSDGPPAPSVPQISAADRLVLALRDLIWETTAEA